MTPKTPCQSVFLGRLLGSQEPGQRVQNVGPSAPGAIFQIPPDIFNHSISKNRGTPKWMIYNGKPYEQMDDLGVPLFLETPICLDVVFKKNMWSQLCHAWFGLVSWIYPTVDSWTLGLTKPKQ